MQLPCAARALDAQRHGLLADDLAEAGVAVQPQQRAGVQHGAHVRVGLEAAFHEGIAHSAAACRCRASRGR
jgi:hypothetical protein